MRVAGIDITLSSSDLAAATADLIVFFAIEGDRRIEGADSSLAKRMTGEAKRRGFRAEYGKTLVFEHVSGKTDCLLVGLGRREGVTFERLRIASATAARQAAALRAKRVAMRPVGAALETFDKDALLRATIEGFVLACYRFDKYLSRSTGGRKSVSGGAGRPERLTIHGLKKSKVLDAAMRRSSAVVDGIVIARDLVNEPANMLYPEEMAKRARSLGRSPQVTVKVLGPRELERQKMGALLAVARGSDRSARLVHIAYKPKSVAGSTRRKRRKIALVGKGVTFDSGGYDLKSTSTMADMKTDMGGAAAVLGAMAAVVQLGSEHEVHCVLALAENMVSGDALKPGDVITARNGRTIEVNNTDAEGRLVLADALDYITEKEDPDVVLDVATLTGACVIALGTRLAGVMSFDRKLAEEILAAASRAGEGFWPLPMVEEYSKQLESSIADTLNTGERYGGATTAALFLSHFVPQGSAWAHLDVAGPVFSSQADPLWGKGGTGFGVATLVDFVLSR